MWINKKQMNCDDTMFNLWSEQSANIHSEIINDGTNSFNLNNPQNYYSSFQQLIFFPFANSRRQQNYYYLMIKLKHINKFHMCRLPPTDSYLQMLQLASKVFGVSGDGIYFLFVDQQDDQIIVSCQDDLDNVVELASESTIKQGKFIIRLEMKQYELSKTNLENQKWECHQQETESDAQILDNSISTLSNCSECNQQDNYVMENGDFKFEEAKSEIMVRNIVRQHLQKIKINAIDKAIAEIQSKIKIQQSQTYLDHLYNEVAFTLPEETDKHKNCLQFDNQQELISLIGNSLNKLLPEFMQKLTEQTIRSVKTIIQSQKNINHKVNAHSLSLQTKINVGN